MTEELVHPEECYVAPGHLVGTLLSAQPEGHVFVVVDVAGKLGESEYQFRGMYGNK